MQNILIIDDDIHIGNMLEESLTKAGYAVSRAYSGTEALLARIAVHLRNAANTPAVSSLECDDLILHTNTHIVTIDTTEIKLTRTEFAILKMLMQNHTQVVTKSLLLARISEDTPDCTESSLKMHISNLRKKLRAVNGKDYIEAVWGIGFKLRTE